ncbi:MAG: substrate-binding periplasmic protein [Bacillota bacterium]
MFISRLVALALLVSFSASAETITLNGEDDWAPYSSATSNYKSVQGLAPDIISAAFKTQGVTVKFRPVPFARCMIEVENGAAIGCFDTIINQDTRDKYIFHKTPLFKADMVVYGPINSSITHVKIKDLEGKIVGHTEGYTYPPQFIENKKIIAAESPTERSQLEKLASGRIQFAIMWGLTGEHIIEQNPHLVRKVKAIGRISQDSLFINFSKVHKDGAKYAAIFEKGMQAIIANGTYKKIEDAFHKKHEHFKEWIPHSKSKKSN